MVDTKVEVTQHDQLEDWRRGIRAMEAQIEANRPIEAEAREKAARDALVAKRETLYLMCKRCASKEGDPYRVRAEVISGLPEASMSVWADGYGVTLTDAQDEAVHEARFRYAQALVSAKVAKDMEAGRERAAKAELLVAGFVE